MIKDSKKSNYNKILLCSTIKLMKNYSLPINNSQKNADTKIEDSRPYIAELVENMPNIRFLEKVQANF